MSKTVKSEKKDQRPWADITGNKKKYRDRIEQEKQAKRTIRDWQNYKGSGDNGSP